MKLISLAIAALAAGTVAAQANTIRYTYDTEADLTRSAIAPLNIVSGPTNTAAGEYHGTTAHVSGTFDVDSSGPTDVITGFNLDTVLPHGLSAGMIYTGNPGGFVVDARVNLSFGAGTTVDQSGSVINLFKVFDFDTRFGTYTKTHYDPNDATPYPFRLQLTMLRQDDGSYNMHRLQMTCAVEPVHAIQCNGYFGSNYGTWDSTSGSAASRALLPANQGQTPAVPLPAGGVLLITGLTALALRKRKA